MANEKAAAEALLPLFKTETILNQDQDGRRVSLYGSIDSQPAVLVIERAPFPSSLAQLSAIAPSLSDLRNLGSNDVYRWYLANSGGSHPQPSDSVSTSASAEATTTAAAATADLKLNLFFPATEKHVRKYSRQRARVVTETAATYAARVRPLVLAQQRTPERLRWIYDILEGRAEADDVIYRTPITPAPAPTRTAAGDEGEKWEGTDGAPSTGFVLLPDLNWDRRTADALHLLALVERRDVWSVRELRRRHVAWLREMRAGIVAAALAAYPDVQEDELKLYMHYPPTYYHMHVHVVHVMAEGGATQAVGKAIGLDAVIAQLEAMAGGDEAGMQDIDLTYTVGEESDLWKEVFGPMKAAKAS